MFAKAIVAGISYGTRYIVKFFEEGSYLKQLFWRLDFLRFSYPLGFEDTAFCKKDSKDLFELEL